MVLRSLVYYSTTERHLQNYPNVILDDVSKSQINIVDFTDATLAFNSSFPNNEIISNNILTYDNVTGNTFQDDEVIRNYKFNYSSNTGEFAAGDNIRGKKTDLY